MISRECFTNEWITAKSKEYGYPDKNIIEKGNNTPLKYSGNPQDIAELEIPSVLTTRLNKLKRSLPEAYFYWAQIGRLL